MYLANGPQASTRNGIIHSLFNNLHITIICTWEDATFTLNQKSFQELLDKTLACLYSIWCISHADSKYGYARISKFQAFTKKTQNKQPENTSLSSTVDTYTENVNTLHDNYIFQWKDDVLCMEISHAISRTTWSNIVLFVLILMHCSSWFQIWTQYYNILYFQIFWKKKPQCKVHSKCARRKLNIELKM